MKLILRDKEYIAILTEIKQKIQNAQIKASISVNKELIILYWEIGKIINVKQRNSKYGDSIVDMLAKDLAREFPSMKGFSRTNLFNIRQWYLFYSKCDSKVQQLVGQLPWGHNVVIINRIKDYKEAVFYLNETLKNNWSRNVLAHQIEYGLYHRKGKVTSNFEMTLPRPQSDLANQTLKDPYIFDFLTLSKDVQEREIEDELIKHLTKFLLELGAGFSFVGKQFHLEIDQQDFYIDLLFYHLRLRCFVAIELKAGEFKPEYAGKINFYLSALDKTKHASDNPSIGLILCKTKNKIIAEYALKDMTQPIGVSEYKILQSVPDKLKSSLPSIKEIERELSKKRIIDDKK
jgi:predicted nuclease of restriction endonuclease-like (RecB) superfamily